MLDLSPENRAAALIDAGLQQAQAIRLRQSAGPFLERLDPEARLFGEYLVEEIARLSAQVEVLSRLREADAMTRAERMLIDPLPFIPAERRVAAAGPEAAPEEGPVAFDVASDDFVGFGWYPAEMTGEGALRWSGLARAATVQLPALGGGALRLTLSLRWPFGAAMDLEALDLFLDGQKLDLTLLSEEGAVASFEAMAVLPELPASSRITLLLHGPRFTDPAAGGRRDSRALGLGLGWLRIERAG